jgi:hypothetical protein
LRLAIADPPYPPSRGERRDAPGAAPRVYTRTRARRWYGDGGRSAGDRPADHHASAAEWDDPARHRALLEQLLDEYDGWAIATTSDGITHYCPLPVPARIMVWHKLRPIPTAHRLTSSWEAVIVYVPEGRRGRPPLGQVPDVLRCASPSNGFVGTKPREWTRWVLDAFGYDQAVDELVDLFPGSGAVSNEAAQGTLL